MKTPGIEHKMMVREILAMTFHTVSDEPVTYSSEGRRHYAKQGNKMVASFYEPRWMWE